MAISTQIDVQLSEGSSFSPEDLIVEDVGAELVQSCNGQSDQTVQIALFPHGVRAFLHLDLAFAAGQWSVLGCSGTVAFIARSFRVSMDDWTQTRVGC